MKQEEMGVYEGLDKAVESFKEAMGKIGVALPLYCDPESDDVHSPKHYAIPGTGVEVIDVIKGILSEEQYMGYCYGNVIKYILRAPNKGGKKDFEKASVYLDWLISAIDAAGEANNESYAAGYEDGYDQGCMDMTDDDLGADCVQE